MYTVETRYKEIWYNKIPDRTNYFLWSQWNKFLCFVLFIDYWYNNISAWYNKQNIMVPMILLFWVSTVFKKILLFFYYYFLLLPGAILWVALTPAGWEGRQSPVSRAEHLPRCGSHGNRHCNTSKWAGILRGGTCSGLRWAHEGARPRLGGGSAGDESPAHVWPDGWTEDVTRFFMKLSGLDTHFLLLCQLILMLSKKLFLETVLFKHCYAGWLWTLWWLWTNI